MTAKDALNAAGVAMPATRYHVTQMTPEAAMQHERRVRGITDPAIGLSWTPYNFYVLLNGHTSAWAAISEEGFNARRIQENLSEPQWSPWREGIRTAWMEEL